MHKSPFNTVGNGLCAVPKDFNFGAFSEKNTLFHDERLRNGTQAVPYSEIRNRPINCNLPFC